MLIKLRGVDENITIPKVRHSNGSRPIPKMDELEAWELLAKADPPVALLDDIDCLVTVYLTLAADGNTGPRFLLFPTNHIAIDTRG